MEFIIFIILILTIIILSSIVSSSEAALLSVSIAKIKEIESNTKNKNKLKKIHNLLDIKNNLQFHLSTIVVSNNVINIMGSIYVGVLATSIFGELYIGLISGILTFLIIIFAEIIPKLYGEKYSLEISLAVANTLKKITWILTPINFIIRIITKQFVKENIYGRISEGEIKEMAFLSHKEGSITESESEMISNVFRLDEMTVYDIMIPKKKTKLINYNSTYDEVIKIIEETGFTRIPIERDGEIIGLINAKDLFKYYNQKENFKIGKILRPILYAPEGMKLNSLEEKFKKEKSHMAIVINEHGDFIGIVTFEDIIEEIIGEIEDEFDPEEKPLINKIENNKYIIDASINLEDLEDELNIEFNDELAEDYSTLNGYLIENFGKIPKVNDIIEIENLNIRILRISKKRILEVEIYVKE